MMGQVGSVTAAVAERPGAGLGVLVNANAKRGGRRVAVQIAQRLSGSKVRLTKTIEEIESWLRILGRPPRGWRSPSSTLCTG